MVSVKAWRHPNQRPAAELPGELRRARSQTGCGSGYAGVPVLR